ncbi:MAG: hypothetical protein WAN65_10980 [Candidatus Sulfotelmatobacter sp.]
MSSIDLKHRKFGSQGAATISRTWKPLSARLAFTLVELLVRHSNYWDFDCAIVAGSSSGARGRTAIELQEQSKKSGAGRAKPL